MSVSCRMASVSLLSSRLFEGNAKQSARRLISVDLHRKQFAVESQKKLPRAGRTLAIQFERFLVGTQFREMSERVQDRDCVMAVQRESLR